MNAISFISQEFGVQSSSLEYIDGPETGVGTEYYVHNKETNETFYVVNDQGDWTFSEVFN